MMDLIQRIQDIMQQQQLNASAFAKKIGVQRSSISHLLSGRNKPSLDLLMKIEEAFEEVSFEWLLKGNKNSERISTRSSTLSQISPGNETEKNPEIDRQEVIQPSKKEELLTVIHYYADGTFERYTKR